MEWENNHNYRVIVDNGSHLIRSGMANSRTPSITFENVTALNRKTGNLLLGDQLDQILIEKEYMYTKPLTRGVLVNLDHELQIWDDLLNKVLKLDESALSFGKLKDFMINMTFPVFIPTKLREKMIEVMFEYYGFGGFYPVAGPEMVKEYAKEEFKDSIDPRFQVVVESGHSATYVAPFFCDEMINYAIKKIDVGGRLLTNCLKQAISFRHIDLSHEYRLVNDIKEKMCYASVDFQHDMRLRKKQFQKYYVLPDPEIKSKGYTTDNIDPTTFREEAVCLDKERFKIPEILFNPSDMGLNECGIRDGILKSLKEVHSDMFEPMLENIIFYGGNTLFDGFQERAMQEIRTITPDFMEPKVNFIK